MADKYDTVSVRMEADDIAAEQFELYCNNKNVEYGKYGLDNKIEKAYKLSRFVRNTPDYIVVNKDAFLVEVKGCKKYLGLKIKDVEQYKLWNQKMNLCYFFYSITYKEHKIVEHKNLMELTATAEIKQYPDYNKYDDKLYYSIYWKSIQ